MVDNIGSFYGCLWAALLNTKSGVICDWVTASDWFSLRAYKLSLLLTLDNPLTRVFWHNWWSPPGGGHQPPGRHWPLLTVKNNRLMELKNNSPGTPHRASNSRAVGAGAPGAWDADYRALTWECGHWHSEDDATAIQPGPHKLCIKYPQRDTPSS